MLSTIGQLLRAFRRYAQAPAWRPALLPFSTGVFPTGDSFVPVRAFGEGCDVTIINRSDASESALDPTRGAFPSLARGRPMQISNAREVLDSLSADSVSEESAEAFKSEVDAGAFILIVGIGGGIVAVLCTPAGAKALSQVFGAAKDGMKTCLNAMFKTLGTVHELVRAHPRVAAAGLAAIVAAPSAVSVTSALFELRAFWAARLEERRSFSAAMRGRLEELGIVPIADQVLRDYVCPIAFTLPQEPVKVATGGVYKYYEREALLAWRDGCVARGAPFSNPHNPPHILDEGVFEVDFEAQAIIQERLFELGLDRSGVEFVEPPSILQVALAAATLQPVVLPAAETTPLQVEVAI